MTRGWPFLTICIPTFNRLNYLKESLQSIMPQINSADIEIYISDNSSTDGTGDYLEAESKKWESLNFNINSENIGLERNMINAIVQSRGRVILPIGDDEVLPMGSLNLIIQELKRHDIDLLALNCWHTDNNLVPVREHLPAILHDNSLSTPTDAFVALWDKTPPGSIVVRKSIITAENWQRFIGTSHAYAGAIWAGLSDIYETEARCAIRCMGAKTVLLRGGHKTWSSWAARINLYEIPIWFKRLESYHSYSNVIPNIIIEYIEDNSSIKKLVYLRAFGGLNKRVYNKIYSIYNKKQIYRIKWILKINPSLLRRVISTLKRLNKIRRFFAKMIRIVVTISK